MSRDVLPLRLEKYEYEGRIGRGAFGTVCRLRRKADSKKVACKSVCYASMSKSHKEQLVTEVNVMRGLKHPHIVRYMDRSIDRTTGTLHIVMELCTGGDLAARIAGRRCRRQKFAEDELWRVAGDVASALRDCHSGKMEGGVILHRDLKPANILFDSENCVKLADFGLAKELKSQNLTRTNLGTPLYMSPELVKRKPYGAPSDIWSLGVILHEAATFSPPFDANNHEDLYAAIIAAEREPITGYSPQFSALVFDILQPNPRARLTASEIVDRVIAYQSATDRCEQQPLNPPRMDTAPPAEPPEKKKRKKEMSDPIAAAAPPPQPAASSPHDRRARLLDAREKILDERAQLLDQREAILEQREQDLDMRLVEIQKRAAATRKRGIMKDVNQQHYHDRDPAPKRHKPLLHTNGF